MKTWSAWNAKRTVLAEWRRMRHHRALRSSNEPRWKLVGLTITDES